EPSQGMLLEWIHHQCYHGEAATIWSLSLLLYQLVMGKHPFRRGQEITWGWILFPQCGLMTILLWQLLRR
ncbi:hypothetical protein HGM15179_020481, partial [Zosterops borbonicus]